MDSSIYVRSLSRFLAIYYREYYFKLHAEILAPPLVAMALRFPDYSLVCLVNQLFPGYDTEYLESFSCVT